VAFAAPGVKKTRAHTEASARQQAQLQRRQVRVFPAGSPQLGRAAADAPGCYARLPSSMKYEPIAPLAHI
jgi:hypothetical protein